MIVGLGAGSVPTASAIVADLVDVARGNQTFLFGVKSDDLGEVNISDISQRVGKYFLRLLINKNSSEEKIFDGKIKIEQAAFFERGDEILCGFLTGEQKESELSEALKDLNPALVKSAKFLRIEATNF